MVKLEQSQKRVEMLRFTGLSGRRGMLESHSVGKEQLATSTQGPQCNNQESLVQFAENLLYVTEPSRQQATREPIFSIFITLLGPCHSWGGLDSLSKNRFCIGAAGSQIQILCYVATRLCSWLSAAPLACFDHSAHSVSSNPPSLCPSFSRPSKKPKSLCV